MRIVSGIYGGRTIAAPKTRGTRPMTDKVRAAIFDSLGDISNYRVLDAYAGTGAVGFEALSRGAAQVDAIESARAPIRTIKENAAALDISWGYSLHEQTVERWLAHAPEERFDLIMADPPYDQIRTDVIERLGQLLVTEGILVVSHSARTSLGALDGLSLVNERPYGDSMISVFHRK